VAKAMVNRGDVSSRSMRHIKLFFLATTLAATLPLLGCDGGEDEVDAKNGTILTDLNTGEQVVLKNIDGRTLITSITSGETKVVPGELEGTLTDEEYTELAQEERDEHESLTAEGLSLSAQPTDPDAAIEQSFSFTTSEWLSWTQYKSNVYTVTANIKNAYTANPFGGSIYVELKKDVLGIDPSYGKKVMNLMTSASPKSLSFSWSVNGTSGDFYIRITRVGGGSSKITGILW